MSGAIPDAASRLDLTITELVWEDIQSGTVEGSSTGAWSFRIDLSRQIDARMV